MFTSVQYGEGPGDFAVPGYGHIGRGTLSAEPACVFGKGLLRFVRELEQGKQTLRIDKVNQVLALFGYEVGAVPAGGRTESWRPGTPHPGRSKGFVEDKAIPLRSKIITIAIMWLSTIITSLLLVGYWWVKALLGLISIGYNH